MLGASSYDLQVSAATTGDDFTSNDKLVTFVEFISSHEKDRAKCATGQGLR